MLNRVRTAGLTSGSYMTQLKQVAPATDLHPESTTIWWRLWMIWQFDIYSEKKHFELSLVNDKYQIWGFQNFDFCASVPCFGGSWWRWSALSSNKSKQNMAWQANFFFFFLFGLEKSNILRSSTCLLVRQVFGDCQVQVIQFLKTTFRQWSFFITLQQKLQHTHTWHVHPASPQKQLKLLLPSELFHKHWWVMHSLLHQVEDQIFASKSTHLLQYLILLSTIY